MIDETVFSSMMEEFTKELQDIKEAVKVLPAKVDKLTTKVEGFENKIKSIKVEAPKPDLLRVHDIVSDGYANI
jgi:archaellum component FlaC